MHFEVPCQPKLTVSCKNVHCDRTDYQECENIKILELIKWLVGDVFVSCLAIFSRRLCPHFDGVGPRCCVIISRELSCIISFRDLLTLRLVS